MSTSAERLHAGFELQRAGRLEEAETLYRGVLQESPADGQGLFFLGVLSHQRGRHDEAIDLLSKALGVVGPNPVIHSNLAAILVAAGRFADAVAQARQAIALDPNLTFAHYHLGTALARLGQFTEAVDSFRAAVHLKPDFAEAHTNLGVALRDSGQPAEAEPCLRESVRLNPTDLNVRVNLGNTLVNLGRIDEARAEYEEALRLDPYCSRAIVALSNLAAAGYYRFSAEQIRCSEELAASGLVPEDSRHTLHFALGAVFDKSGDWTKAFEHIRLGNEMRKEKERHRGIVFDIDAERRKIDRLIAAFTPAHFERVRGFGLETERPIFVVGMMRSGTTLIEQILASHPLMWGAGELQALGAIVNTFSQRLGVTERYPACVRQLNAETARRLGEDYEQALVQRGGEALRVVDKLPTNFLNLGLIATILPRARIIHCRRDPVDTCLSCYFQDFGPVIPYTWDLRHLGQYYREYRRLMAHWAAVLPMPVFDLCYEDLTANQEAVTRRLIDFCGLEWDERCLAFQDNPRPVRTASVLQVRQPMYRGAVGRWKHYESFLTPLLEELRVS